MYLLGELGLQRIIPQSYIRYSNELRNQRGSISRTGGDQFWAARLLGPGSEIALSVKRHFSILP
jgi:hypothetical protein